MANQTDKNKSEKRKYNVPAVEIAFKILRLLSRKKFSHSTLTEIANALGLTPTTCYRILQQLQEDSIVRYDKKSKQYSLGPYLVVLGERAKDNSLVIAVILPYLEELAEKTGLTSVLVNRVGETRTTIVTKVDGRDFGVHVSLGRHFPIAETAHGKCLLAFMEEEESDELFSKIKDQNVFTDQEISDLKSEFPAIRSNGYATNYGLAISGVFGIASPIFNLDEKVDMAIGLFGLTAQYQEEELDEKGELLSRAAEEISMKLSGHSNAYV